MDMPLVTCPEKKATDIGGGFELVVYWFGGFYIANEVTSSSQVQKHFLHCQRLKEEYLQKLVR